MLEMEVKQQCHQKKAGKQPSLQPLSTASHSEVNPEPLPEDSDVAAEVDIVCNKG